jgi:hypothetical protein
MNVVEAHRHILQRMRLCGMSGADEIGSIVLYGCSPNISVEGGVSWPSWESRSTMKIFRKRRLERTRNLGRCALEVEHPCWLVVTGNLETSLIEN